MYISVPKNYANCWTDKVFLFTLKFLIGPGKVYYYLGEGTTTHKRKDTSKKIPETILLLKLKMEGRLTPPPPSTQVLQFL